MGLLGYLTYTIRIEVEASSGNYKRRILLTIKDVVFDAQRLRSTLVRVTKKVYI